MTLDARYIAMREIALAAGALAQRFFERRETLAIEAKGPQDWVSRADREVEAFIRAELFARFPGDGFLGEETAATFDASLDRVWIVDPIDGTHNFLRGARYYCVSIAYAEREARVLGAVYDPVHDELFYARRGHGSWGATKSGTGRLAVSNCRELAQAFVGLGHHDRAADPRYLTIREKMMAAGVAMRNMGAGALQLAHVAAGHFDGFIELSLNAWDAMAGLLLVEEAGGYVFPFPGPQGLLKGGVTLACAPGIAAPLLCLTGLDH